MSDWTNIDARITPLEYNDSAVRFEVGKHAHIDVRIEKSGALIIHADGLSGQLVIRPLVSNEVVVTVAEHYR